MGRWHRHIFIAVCGFVFVGFVPYKDKQYVDHCLRLYSADLFRQKQFTLNYVKVYYGYKAMDRLSISFTCFRSLTLKDARKLLVETVSGLLEKINDDHFLREKGLLPGGHFCLNRISLEINAENFLTAGADGQTGIKKIVLEEGSKITYDTYTTSPYLRKGEEEIHENYRDAYLLVQRELGKAPGFDIPASLQQELRASKARKEDLQKEKARFRPKEETIENFNALTGRAKFKTRSTLIEASNFAPPQARRKEEEAKEESPPQVIQLELLVPDDHQGIPEGVHNNDSLRISKEHLLKIQHEKPIVRLVEKMKVFVARNKREEEQFAARGIEKPIALVEEPQLEPQQESLPVEAQEGVVEEKKEQLVTLEVEKSVALVEEPQLEPQQESLPVEIQEEVVEEKKEQLVTLEVEKSVALVEEPQLEPQQESLPVETQEEVVEEAKEPLVTLEVEKSVALVEEPQVEPQQESLPVEAQEGAVEEEQEVVLSNEENATPSFFQRLKAFFAGKEDTGSEQEVTVEAVVQPEPVLAKDMRPEFVAIAAAIQEQVQDQIQKQRDQKAESVLAQAEEMNSSAEAPAEAIQQTPEQAVEKPVALVEETKPDQVQQQESVPVEPPESISNIEENSKPSFFQRIKSFFVKEERPELVAVAKAAQEQVQQLQEQMNEEKKAQSILAEAEEIMNEAEQQERIQERVKAEQQAQSLLAQAEDVNSSVEEPAEAIQEETEQAVEKPLVLVEEAQPDQVQQQESAPVEQPETDSNIEESPKLSFFQRIKSFFVKEERPELVAVAKVAQEQVQQLQEQAKEQAKEEKKAPSILAEAEEIMNEAEQQERIQERIHERVKAEQQAQSLLAQAEEVNSDAEAPVEAIPQNAEQAVEKPLVLVEEAQPDQVQQQESAPIEEPETVFNTEENPKLSFFQRMKSFFVKEKRSEFVAVAEAAQEQVQQLQEQAKEQAKEEEKAPSILAEAEEIMNEAEQQERIQERIQERVKAEQQAQSLLAQAEEVDSSAEAPTEATQQEAEQEIEQAVEKPVALVEETKPDQMQQQESASTDGPETVSNTEENPKPSFFQRIKSFFVKETRPELVAVAEAAQEQVQQLQEQAQEQAEEEKEEKKAQPLLAQAEDVNSSVEPPAEAIQEEVQQLQEQAKEQAKDEKKAPSILAEAEEILVEANTLTLQKRVKEQQKAQSMIAEAEEVRSTPDEPCEVIQEEAPKVVHIEEAKPQEATDEGEPIICFLDEGEPLSVIDEAHEKLPGEQVAPDEPSEAEEQNTLITGEEFFENVVSEQNSR